MNLFLSISLVFLMSTTGALASPQADPDIQKIEQGLQELYELGAGAIVDFEEQSSQLFDQFQLLYQSEGFEDCRKDYHLGHKVQIWRGIKDKKMKECTRLSRRVLSWMESLESQIHLVKNEISKSLKNFLVLTAAGDDRSSMILEDAIGDFNGFLDFQVFMVRSLESGLRINYLMCSDAHLESGNFNGYRNCIVSVTEKKLEMFQDSENRVDYVRWMYSKLENYIQKLHELP